MKRLNFDRFYSKLNKNKFIVTRLSRSYRVGDIVSIWIKGRYFCHAKCLIRYRKIYKTFNKKLIDYDTDQNPAVYKKHFKNLNPNSIVYIHIFKKTDFK
ncbi:MAG: hypothetical protein ACTSQP_22395 [Promethearchaeota archaeon]